MKHPCKHTRAWRSVRLAKKKFWRIPASIYRQVTLDKLLYRASIFINSPKIKVFPGCDCCRVASPNRINEDEIALIKQAVWRPRELSPGSSKPHGRGLHGRSCGSFRLVLRGHHRPDDRHHGG